MISKEQLLQFLVSRLSKWLPSSIHSVALKVREMLFEGFQDGGHGSHLKILQKLSPQGNMEIHNC